MRYAERRQELYGKMREEGVFTWDFLYGEEYALATCHRISEEQRRELAEATRLLGGVFQKAVLVLQQGGDALLRELGIPPEAWGAVRVVVDPGLPTVVGRFDFAPTAKGLKMLELNADTPTGIVEAFYANGKVCEAFGLDDPNRGMQEAIGRAFRGIADTYRRLGYPVENVFFSALDWHEEDAGTTRYLLRQSGLAGRFVPLADLRVYEDRLQAWTGEELVPVDLLYRLHALEKLAEDRDEDGYPTGAHVLDLIARKKLAIINPPSAFLAQTKALQAILWNLQESGEFFDEAERDVIRTYMLPTYLENRFTGRRAYVKKPIFGREGGAVTLFDAEGRVIERDRELEYWDQPMVYQELVELEMVETETLRGPFRGHLLWGSFWLGGEASAIVARVGGRITGNLSCFLPVGL
jgi:glutathionylspermidine synthase